MVTIKKLLTSLLLILILAASFSVLIRIQPVRATTFITEDFETWNSNGWSIAGSGTQSDETGIVYGGSHSRKFVAAAGQNIFIYKYDFATATLVNATFYLYLPSDLNIASGQGTNNRRELFEFWADMAEDWGIWNNSGTIESYVIGIDTVYLTNGTLSLGAWHSISVAVNITDVGWMKLAIDGSLIWQRNGDFYDTDNTPDIYMGAIYTAANSPITCYIDDLTLTDVVTEEPPSTFTVQVTSSPEINADYTINGTSHQTPHNETDLDAGSYNFTVTDINITVGSVDYNFDHWLINGTTNDTDVSILLSITADTDLAIVYETINHYPSRFRSEPSGSYVYFSAGGSWYWCPQDLNLTQGSQTFTISSGSLIAYVTPTLIYGFDHWSITNTTGTFNSTGSSVTYNLQEDTNITMAYKTIKIQVTASPALPVYFSSEYYGSNYSAPQTLNWNSGSHNFTALTHTYSPNSSYVYTFDHWLVNGTDEYGSLSISLSFTADTNLTMAYVGSTVTPPYPYTYVSGALNATWYFRSDTWTVHSILGYKLQTVNTATPTFDERIDAATKNVSYGVRVWALDLFGNQYELTSGTPAAVATKITEGSEMLVGYWTCPAYSSMIDSIKVNLYQQFNDEGWSLRRIYVTGSDLLIRLPSASWTFHYYVNRTVGSTYSTFGFGSYTIYNSRIDLQYYKASPWDVALARLWQRNFVGFLFTPWTYWFGDLFWSIILFGCIIMAWMRTGSFKPVLALLWIIGGSGSILWALIPASALHIAVVMLALAMAITFFRLIRGK